MSDDKNCLPCRLVSGFGVIGMGYYVYHHSRNQSKNNKLILNGVSLLIGAVGVARLLDVYPFGKDR